MDTLMKNTTDILLSLLLKFEVGEIEEIENLEK